jgi:hypothetical protein
LADTPPHGARSANRVAGGQFTLLKRRVSRWQRAYPGWHVVSWNTNALSKWHDLTIHSRDIACLPLGPLGRWAGPFLPKRFLEKEIAADIKTLEKMLG